jgi:hypothetical protein
MTNSELALVFRRLAFGVGTPITPQQLLIISQRVCGVHVDICNLSSAIFHFIRASGENDGGSTRLDNGPILKHRSHANGMNT